MAIYPRLQRPKTTSGSKKYPYLFRGINIWLSNQIWASDITYFRLSDGYVYLVTIIDLYSRKVYSWRFSSAMDPQSCVAALEKTIVHYGIPSIFNTNQENRFTSDTFVSGVKEHEIQISMDSVNQVLDNIFVERFLRSLKYESLYLKDYRTMVELKVDIDRYIRFCISERFHQSLEYKTSDVIYGS
ncbi:transposase [Macellibacteroides fermentans]|uniref:transposase n=1 Tax=Macellibacteroides fermentans TaxID=879969 RepID=UPI00406CA246